MLQLENKCRNLEAPIKKFHRKFNALHQKELPGLQGIGGRFIPLYYYQHRLHEIAVYNAKFSKIIGKDFIEGLNYDLFIQHEIEYFFLTRPTFEIYVEVDESYINLVNFSIPNEKMG